MAATISLVSIFSAAGVARLLRAVNAERARSSAILRSLAEGVVITDTEGRVEAFNPALSQLLGLHEDQARGRKFCETFRVVDDRSGTGVENKDLLLQAIAERRPIAANSFKTTLTTLNGKTLPVAITAAPIIGSGGDVVGGVAVIRDVSREKEIDGIKTAFIGTVSHELRTPLTMIQGFASLLLSRQLDPEETTEPLERISASAERLEQLIDDLLSVSKIESGALKFQRAPLDIASVIGEVVDTFGERRKIAISVEPAVPQVLGDRNMIVHVLTNLISNAIKYSPEGAPIDVEANAVGCEVRVCVRDRGIGLSEDQISRLFHKFYRADRREVREAGGAGLGLFITRKLIELQGGRIWVKSALGEGSEFNFSLRIAGQPQAVLP